MLWTAGVSKLAATVRQNSAHLPYKISSYQNQQNEADHIQQWTLQLYRLRKVEIMQSPVSFTAAIIFFHELQSGLGI